jgi:hypothetical protein
MVYYWDINGTSMVCSWDINGIFMGYAWAINGIVVGYSWDIHEYNESHHDSWLNHHDIPFTSHRK